jgi:hypothetical protein
MCVVALSSPFLLLSQTKQRLFNACVGGDLETVRSLIQQSVELLGPLTVDAHVPKSPYFAVGLSFERWEMREREDREREDR